MKAVFLDRDGVINEDYGYVHKIEDFKFRDGVFEGCKYLQDKGYKLFIVTNQSGINRGYYTKEDFLHLTEWMKKQFLENNIEIIDVEFCPHKPDEGCECRKPNIGMIKNLVKKYDIDLSQSIMIGDKDSDMKLAENAGIDKKILIQKNDNFFDIIKKKGI